MIVAELSMMAGLDEATAGAMRPYATAYLLATLALSAAMNAFAFAGSDVVVERCFGVGLGCVIPALTFCLTKIAARLHMPVAAG